MLPSIIISSLGRLIPLTKGLLDAATLPNASALEGREGVCGFESEARAAGEAILELLGTENTTSGVESGLTTPLVVVTSPGTLGTELDCEGPIGNSTALTDVGERDESPEVGDGIPTMLEDDEGIVGPPNSSFTDIFSSCWKNSKRNDSFSFLIRISDGSSSFFSFSN